MSSRSPETIELNGFALPLGSSVIHFYYTPTERKRMLSFLLEGINNREGVVLACTKEGYDELGPAIGAIGLGSPGSGLMQVEISPDLPASIRSISHATRLALRDRPRGRMLADFGSMVGKESIFKLESALASALGQLKIVSVLQYDGTVFDASVTIEQFRTHALAIMGNAFYHENLNFTSADAYYRRRAAGARK
jgi:hypothetical protein